MEDLQLRKPDRWVRQRAWVTRYVDFEDINGLAVRVARRGAPECPYLFPDPKDEQHGAVHSDDEDPSVPVNYCREETCKYHKTLGCPSIYCIQEHCCFCSYLKFDLPYPNNSPLSGVYLPCDFCRDHPGGPNTLAED